MWIAWFDRGITGEDCMGRPPHTHLFLMFIYPGKARDNRARLGVVSSTAYAPSIILDFPVTKAYPGISVCKISCSIHCSEKW